MSLNETSPGQTSRARSTPPSATDKATTRRRQELTRQRESWRRRPWLACGCSEICRCDYRSNPTPKRIDAYREALEHLASQKLLAAALAPELRALWRRGGSDRELAQSVVRRWTA